LSLEDAFSNLAHAAIICEAKVSTLEDEMADLRYPIGKFTYNGTPTEDQKQKYLGDIEQTPSNLRKAVQGLSAQQLDTPYRPEGWTVRLLRSLRPEDWKRTFRHPDLGPMPLEKNLALYAWHGRHHVAHITALRERSGW
jgi:hypothetical protein